VYFPELDKNYVVPLTQVIFLQTVNPNTCAKKDRQILSDNAFANTHSHTYLTLANNANFHFLVENTFKISGTEDKEKL